MTEKTQSGEAVIGLVSVSDRASRGEYQDEGIPALQSWCEKAIITPKRFVTRLIPDDRYTIERTLVSLVDDEKCDLVLTTGGTGPSRRDVTPEATLAAATRELPGFGEQMRAISLHFVPTAILSRQVGALREIPGHAALIVNLPGQPKSIVETLGGLQGEDGSEAVPGIFAAIPYCIDLIGGPWMETDPAICRTFRPKSALDARARELTAREAAKPLAQDAAQPSSKTAAPERPGLERKPYVDPDPVRVPRETSATISPAVQPLEIFTLCPAGNSLPPPCAVIWLGAMGTDVHDFSELPEQVWHLGGPAARYYMVNAPRIELSAAPGKRIRAWFDLPARSGSEDEARIRSSADQISRLVEQVAAKGMPRKRIFLAGFSQGGSMALFTGLRQELALGGLIALSAHLPLVKTLPAEIKAGGLSTPVFMGHGAYDDVVPLPLAEQSARLIRSCGAPLLWREYEAEHDFGEEALEDMAGFLRRAIEGGF